jgi:hypothetical protein
VRCDTLFMWVTYQDEISLLEAISKDAAMLCSGNLISFPPHKRNHRISAEYTLFSIVLFPAFQNFDTLFSS